MLAQWSAWLLAVAMALTAGYALVRWYQQWEINQALTSGMQAILGYDRDPLPKLLEKMAVTIKEAGRLFNDLEPASIKEFTLETWSVLWRELLRTRDLPPAWLARAMLQTAGDDRSLDVFVRETMGLQRNLHKLLCAEDAEGRGTAWAKCAEDLAVVVASATERGKSGSAGLMSDLASLRESHDAVAKELALAHANGDRAAERMNALSPMLECCGIAATDDVTSVARAAKGVESLLRLVREEVKISAAQETASLAEALGARLQDLRDSSTRHHHEIVSTKLALDECVQERDAARATGHASERHAHELSSRMQLAPPEGRSSHVELKHLLQGDRWTLRLVLLAAREAWPSAAARIAADLAERLRIAEVPAQCTAALVSLERLVVMEKEALPITFDAIESLCRAFDTTVRISEVRSTYRLQELNPLEPWASVVARAVKDFLVARRVGIRRPPLLRRAGSDYDKFDGKARAESLQSLAAIDVRIREELDSGNDGFVTDVIQSEVVIGDTIRRGVLSIVSPHRSRI